MITRPFRSLYRLLLQTISKEQEIQKLSGQLDDLKRYNSENYSIIHSQLNMQNDSTTSSKTYHSTDKSSKPDQQESQQSVGTNSTKKTYEILRTRPRRKPRSNLTISSTSYSGGGRNRQSTSSAISDASASSSAKIKRQSCLAKCFLCAS
jgi:hypothetical protein